MAADPKSPTALPEGFAKRVVSIPGSASPGSVSSGETGKKLVVGKDICLSGEITACDTLVVEGQVEASLKDSRMFEVTESGDFKGKVEIDVAEIRGKFEGELTAKTRLIIRRSGVATGTIRYRLLEIEQGGEIAGTVEVLPDLDGDGDNDDSEAA
ncbi:MAG TPA: cell shape determination protein CcmA [Rhodospirillaceae bacterium]|nr:cell shape determination protein CcmA [Rhodospirillaceae bacterium]HAT34841.1 cell shape determination protein CcmA [Rhodospirillaceae bacterium]